MKQYSQYITFVACCIFISSCASRPGISSRKFSNYIGESPVFSTHFTGFALYDTELEEMVYTYEADKYYTPASNTKIFTLYASLRLLGDSIPALQYELRDDTLYFTGTGDPTFLHPDISEIDTTYDQRVYRFLREKGQALVYYPRPTEDDYFGPGWSWSDYNYYYSTERSVFPLYANVVRFSFLEGVSKPMTSPDFFTSYVEGLPVEGLRPIVRRQQFDNYFTYALRPDSLSFERDVPFIQSSRLTGKLLGDTLRKRVIIRETGEELPVLSRKLYSLPADSVYQRMMRNSDNFFAEQLLMLCSSQFKDTLSTEWTIDYVKEHYLNDLPDEPIWVDGSGLSRYNLQTPRTIVALLQKVDEELSDERIKTIFPAGGESGTIRSWYPNPEGGEPFVFAKTGTLSNKSALSGFLYTRSGKKLIFSFLHNNYITSTSPLKREMEKILQDIYLNY
jgi:D-alanyl-D-alanine carboxypeptidase/D-alanyl-D-alanine-endopeptidase (penicillin-binding protein 4)